MVSEGRTKISEPVVRGDLDEEAKTSTSDGTNEPTLAQSRNFGGRNLVRLLLVLAIVIYGSYLLGILATLGVVAAIVAMIMVHEFGHYLTAKFSHMKVTEYFLGFGPRIWSFRYGETEYGIKALPLGGYVKIIGMSSAEEVDPSDENRTYRHASFPRRFAVGIAGSFMHFVMAFGLLVIFFATVGQPSPHVLEIGSVAHFQGSRSPAVAAGLRPGEVITAVNGRPVRSANVLVDALGNGVGRPVRLTLLEGSKILHAVVTPVDGTKVRVNGHAYLPANSKSRGVIGVSLVEGTTNEAFLPALGSAVHELGTVSSVTVTSLLSHFSPHGISTYLNQFVHPSTNVNSAGVQSRFASPVGIVRYAADAAASGWPAILWLLMSINVFVGIFNMVPLLPLDGGHVVIAIYERIRSRKGRPYRVDVMKLMPVTYAVILVLVLLSVSALYLDITHPVGNPFG